MRLGYVHPPHSSPTAPTAARMSFRCRIFENHLKEATAIPEQEAYICPEHDIKIALAQTGLGMMLLLTTGMLSGAVLSLSLCLLLISDPASPVMALSKVELRFADPHACIPLYPYSSVSRAKGKYAGCRPMHYSRHTYTHPPCCMRSIAWTVTLSPCMRTSRSICSCPLASSRLFTYQYCKTPPPWGAHVCAKLACLGRGVTDWRYASMRHATLSQCLFLYS